MFRKIIVAVDGEEGGLDAIALARALAGQDAELIVGRVVVSAKGPEGVADAVADDTVLAARRGISDADHVRTVGVLVHARSVAGGLHRLADEQSADLLVVGSHHRGRTGHLWSADRTRATLRDAPCPVAVAPRGYAGRPRATIRSVGVGYDEGVEARAALELGRSLASGSGADLQALEVVPETNWQTPESGAGWKAVEAGRRLSQLGGVTGVVVEGDVHDRLAQFAHEVDVLILGLPPPRACCSRLVLGHTVEGMTRHLACALLVMPHAAPRTRREGLSDAFRNHSGPRWHPRLMTATSLLGPADSRGRRMLNKVPEITLWFWVIKILCTTVGETAADYLNDTLGFGLSKTSYVMSALLIVALVFQFRLRRYVPGVYWLAVVLISVVGTLITDNLTDNYGVALTTTTIVFAVALAATFARLVPGRAHTLDPHDLHDPSRGVLLAGDPVHIRPRDRRRRPHRGEAGPRLPAVAAAVREPDRRGHGRALPLSPQRRPVVLDGVHPDPPARGVDRGSLSQAKADGGLGLGTTATSFIFLGTISAVVVYLAITKRDVAPIEPANA